MRVGPNEQGSSPSGTDSTPRGGWGGLAAPAAAVALVALSLGGLLLGFEPVGEDPDTMYRPIKAELSRSLAGGGLPFWSDRLGLGTPLVAESHVAAFYPPNWLLYRLLDVPRAYRLAMWLHYVALAGSTYFYARALRLTPWGGALAAVSFSLCGFAASHACHEPFYHLLPYLPLALGLAERYLADGRLGWLAALALALGAQLTVGHFQVQAWTAGLVLLTGVWRAWGGETPWRRGLALAAAVGWAGAVAAAQLALTAELTGFAGFARGYRKLADHAFPPAHWAQLALPRLFSAFRDGRADRYWYHLRVSADEASLYVGTVALVLAAAGYLARGDRPLSPWRWLAPLGLLLATMPYLWPDGYALLTRLPVIGHFRAPARFTLLTSLGLCLLAGRGFDRAGGARPFWLGFALAAAFAASAAAWGYVWSSGRDVSASLDGHARILAVAGAAAAWLVALGAAAAWRRGRLPDWAPVLLAACELTYLFYQGSTRWGWSVRVPEDSPALSRLSREAGVGSVCGRVRDLPVRFGQTAADPYLGIPLIPRKLLPGAPTSLSERPDDLRLAVRFGVTHRVVDEPATTLPGRLLSRGPDPSLDALVTPQVGQPRRRVWRVERLADAPPSAWAAVRVRQADNRNALYEEMADAATGGEVWFLRDDRPPPPSGPFARSARVVRWDGRSGEVEHDGACDLVIPRSYYPGWVARVNGGPAVPVSPADGLLQLVRLTGSGVSRVSVEFRPARLGRYASISVVATASAALVLAASLARGARERT